MYKRILFLLLSLEEKDKSPRYSANGYTSHVSPTVIYFSHQMLTNLKEYIDETIKKCHEESD